MYKRGVDEIYIVYTPKFSRLPTDDCWIIDNYSYKDVLKTRFQSLSYRDNIYPWLKEEILPIIDKKNLLIYTAVTQYIDHLEGLFGLRTKEKSMNMKLQEFIKEKFELNDNMPAEAIEILSVKEKEINNAISQIQKLKNHYKKMLVVKYFEEWEKKLRKDFSDDLIVVGDKFKLNKKVINTGIIFKLNNKSYAAIIECNDYNKPNIYYGIGHHFIGDKKEIIPESLQELLSDKELTNPKEFWYGRKYTSLENGYSRLENLINEIIIQTKNI